MNSLMYWILLVLVSAPWRTKQNDGGNTEELLQLKEGEDYVVPSTLCWLLEEVQFPEEYAVSIHDLMQGSKQIS